MQTAERTATTFTRTRLRRSMILFAAASAAILGAVGSTGVAAAATTTTSIPSSPAGELNGQPVSPPTTTTTTTTTIPTIATTPPNPPNRDHAGTGTTSSNTTFAALNGVGSSFAAPAVETWDNDVANSPYSLSINYSSTNSGDGRYEFTNQTTDFAVSDIGYVGNTDTTPPSFPFIFVPITAGGIAFMYNIPGLTQNLQLTSYTACAILTGQITNWDDSHIASENPGVTLPNLPIVPVTESDSAGTNYVLEEWCIDEQPALWAAFVHNQDTQSGGVTDGVALSATSPNSNWPGIQGGLDDQTTTAVASDVATNPGGIGAVQVQYAIDLGFDQSDPAKGVAEVQNASGDYTLPTPVDVASALAYATQLPNGTHVLNFNGIGAHVYNPSTYSYLLTPTTGWSTSKGATMSSYVNYVLTLGQQEAPKFGYASLGLSLEQYGVNAVTLDVPGAVAVTSAEKAAYSCGDLTPTEVQAGQTTPTCGVTNTVAPPPPPNGGNGGTSTGTSTTTGTSGTTGSSGGGAAAGGNVQGVGVSASEGVGASGSGGSSVDPGVSLSGSASMAFTGGNPLPLTIVGLLMVAIGWIGRRRLLRTRAGEPSG
jgi:ABC-type phosphate transport system substrate-binding protein